MNTDCYVETTIAGKTLRYVYDLESFQMLRERYPTGMQDMETFAILTPIEIQEIKNNE